MGWWVAEVWNSGGAIPLVSWIFWVVFSICLHELGHGFAAIRSGDRTPIELGRMTLNPLVHMGQTSLIVFAIFGIAWGVMPVTPSRFRGRFDDAKVAAAGPAVNLMLAIVCVLLLALVIRLGPSLPGLLGENLRVFFQTGAMLNVVLMLFNLLPVPPLDGSRIVGTFVPAFDRFMRTQQGALAGLALFVGIFFFAGNQLFRIADESVRFAVGLLT